MNFSIVSTSYWFSAIIVAEGAVRIECADKKRAEWHFCYSALFPHCPSGYGDIVFYCLINENRMFSGVFSFYRAFKIGWISAHKTQAWHTFLQPIQLFSKLFKLKVGVRDFSRSDGRQLSDGQQELQRFQGEGWITMRELLILKQYLWMSLILRT